MYLDKILSFLALFLMPLMDSPLFPVQTYLKSFSILIILLLTFIYFSNSKIPNRDKNFNYFILIFAAVNLINSLFLAGLNIIQLNYFRLLRSVIEFFIVYAMHEFFLGVFFKYDLKKVFRIILSSFLLIVMPYGLIQIFAFNNIFGGFTQTFFGKVDIILHSVFHSGYAIGEASNKLYASYTEPSTFSLAILLVYLPLSLSLILHKKYAFYKKIIFVRIEHFVALFCFIFIYFSFSRTGFGMMSILLVVAFILYAQNQKGMKGKLKIGLSLVFCLISVGLLVGVGVSQNYLKIINTLSNIEDNYSNVTRYAGWLVALQIFLRYPFFGVGLNNFYQFYNQLVPGWALASPEVMGFIYGEYLADPKNVLARLLCETGIFGFLFFIFLLTKRFLRILSFKKNLHIPPYLRHMAIMCAISLFMSFFSVGSIVFPEQLFALAMLSFVCKLSEKKYSLKE